MEQHPVPQNVIGVEFKLFGSFTLKQFGKIMIGCVAGLGFFFSGLPIYLSLPLTAASVLLGLGTAIVPQLGTWVSGYIKALFISPRYVWMKQGKAPEVLTQKQRAELDQSQKVTTAKNQRKVDLSEISLNKLLATRADSGPDSQESKDIVNPQVVGDPLEVKNNQARGSNFDRVFEDVYKDSPIPQSTSAGNMQIQNQNVEQPVQMRKELITEDDYLNEINYLKQQLNELVKSNVDQSKQKEIMDRINNLTAHLSLMNQAQGQASSNVSVTTSANVKDMQGQSVAKGQNIFGILVDSKNVPVMGAQVDFRDINTGNIITAISGDDGRFASQSSLPVGTYDVTIEHPKFRFHTYRIDVGQQKLPAYKFRAR